MKSLSARRSKAVAQLARLSIGAFCLAMLCLLPASAQTEQKQPLASPILTINPDRLFEGSDYGRRTVAEIERMGAVLSTENLRIQEELTTEEKKLTELRPTMSAAEFRELADQFDTKVQEVRRTQDAKSRELNATLEERRVIFLNAAAPILEQLMREAGAFVVLEQRSVFISSNAVDITDLAIERLNAVLESGDIPEPKE